MHVRDDMDILKATLLARESVIGIFAGNNAFQPT